MIYCEQTSELDEFAIQGLTYDDVRVISAALQKHLPISNDDHRRATVLCTCLAPDIIAEFKPIS